jgi:hypothetical protein
VAGRDLYDIHYFFIHNYTYNPDIIIERRNTNTTVFFTELIEFIQKHITTRTLQQDLNPLLPVNQFQRVYKTLKQETIMLLQDELKRIQSYA